MLAVWRCILVCASLGRFKKGKHKWLWKIEVNGTVPSSQDCLFYSQVQPCSVTPLHVFCSQMGPYGALLRSLLLSSCVEVLLKSASLELCLCPEALCLANSFFGTNLPPPKVSLLGLQSLVSSPCQLCGALRFIRLDKAEAWAICFCLFSAFHSELTKEAEYYFIFWACSWHGLSKWCLNKWEVGSWQKVFIILPRVFSFFFQWKRDIC